MVTKVFNIQPVLFHQCYLCHLLWFKKQSFTLVWKPNPPVCLVGCAPSRSCWWSECSSIHEALRWMCISSCDQWNLTPATMCCGSAARVLYEAETLEQRTMHLHKCDHVFFLRGGGVVRLTAKPRYLLLLHRGNKKSNTVTALITGTDKRQGDHAA